MSNLCIKTRHYRHQFCADVTVEKIKSLMMLKEKKKKEAINRKCLIKQATRQKEQLFNITITTIFYLIRKYALNQIESYNMPNCRASSIVKHKKQDTNFITS